MDDMISKMIQIANEMLLFSMFFFFFLTVQLFTLALAAFKASAAALKPVRHSKVLPGCSLSFFILLSLFVGCLRKLAWLLQWARDLECLNML